MSDAVAATGTPAPAATATPVAETTSALATAAKSAGVESMLAAAAKAAASTPEKHDAEAAKAAAAEAYGKLEFEGVPEPVTKAGREAFAKNNVAPEAAKEIVAALVEAQRAAEKAALAETDAAWQKELREDKEFGGANYERNTKLVEAAVSGLLTKEQAQRAKDSGWLNHPLTGLFAMAAERIVAKATKQDATAVGSPPGPVREDVNDLSPAALARSFGTI